MSTRMATADERERIIAVIDTLLAERSAGKTICPSEVARRLVDAHPPEAVRWRPWMPAVRSVAGELAAAGLVKITQRGERVDIHTARGPVRIGRPNNG